MSVHLIFPPVWSVEKILFQFCGEMKVMNPVQSLLAHSFPDVQPAQLQQRRHTWAGVRGAKQVPWQRDVLVIIGGTSLTWEAMNIFTGRLLGYFGRNTSGLSQQPLRRAVGRCEVQGLLAFQVPAGLIRPVVEQLRQHLRAGETSGDMQGRVTRHTAVCTGTWGEADTNEVWYPRCRRTCLTRSSTAEHSVNYRELTHWLDWMHGGQLNTWTKDLHVAWCRY